MKLFYRNGIFVKDRSEANINNNCFFSRAPDLRFCYEGDLKIVRSTMEFVFMVNLSYILIGKSCVCFKNHLSLLLLLHQLKVLEKYIFTNKSAGLIHSRLIQAQSIQLGCNHSTIIQAAIGIGNHPPNSLYSTLPTFSTFRGKTENMIIRAHFGQNTFLIQGITAISGPRN